MGRRAAAAALALFQVGGALELSSVSRHQSLARTGCAALDNKGTHFTIDVEVGTPGQKFAVVADTGSNTLIVPSCLCQQKGHCPQEDHCFTGTNRSSSFEIRQSSRGEPDSMVLTFGSGKIQGVVARDKVKVGQVEAFLDDGMLLMTDRALNIKGAFEGILGLGVPQAEEAELNESEAQAAAAAEAGAAGKAGQPGGGKDFQDVIQKILQQVQQQQQAGGGGHGHQGGGNVIDVEDGSAEPMEDNMRKRFGGISAAQIGKAMSALGPNLTQTPLEDILRQIWGGGGGGGMPMPMQMPMPAQMQRQRASPKGFLEQAKVDRFSVCFNDGADGVLRLGNKMPKKSHGGIGKQHWGVDFRGISVGKGNESAAKALFCNEKNMSEGQSSPCGAIPDSGTTVLTGPESQINKLLEGICDSWDRCRSNYTKLQLATKTASEDMERIYGFNPFNLQGHVSKKDILQAVLADCETWMDPKVGLSELPPMHFHVQGSNGTKQTLTLPGHLYVMEAPKEQVSQVQLLKTGGAYDIPVDPSSNATSKGKVCMPAFGAMDYNTRANGPVWILGTPLFYKFVVGYDVSTNPPSISFSDQTETPCGTCGQAVDPKGLKLWAVPEDEAEEAKLGPRGIFVDQRPRMPRIDTTKPL